MNIRKFVPWAGETFKVHLFMGMVSMLPFILVDVVWLTLLDRHMDTRVIIVLIALTIAAWLVGSWLEYIAGKPYRSQIDRKPHENLIIKYAPWKKWDFKSLWLNNLLVYTASAVICAAAFLPIKGKGAGETVLEITLSVACLVLVSTLLMSWYGRRHAAQLSKPMEETYNGN